MIENRKAHYEVMLIQILAPTSNLPDGVNILTSGGLNAVHQLKSPKMRVDVR